MWIRCNDRLPVPGAKILFVSENCIYCGSLGCCDEGYKWYTEDCTIDLVSHWMPLPAPPNSEEMERNNSAEAKPVEGAQPSTGIQSKDKICAVIISNCIYDYCAHRPGMANDYCRECTGGDNFVGRKLRPC